MNWSITTWAPLAKSPNCASQITSVVGLRGGIAVLEAEHRLFGQQRVDDHEVRPGPVADVSAAGCRCPASQLLAVLVVQHRVAVEEGAARRRPARTGARRSRSSSRRGVGQVLGHAPVDRQLALAPSGGGRRCTFCHPWDAARSPSGTVVSRSARRCSSASGTVRVRRVGPLGARRTAPSRPRTCCLKFADHRVARCARLRRARRGSRLIISSASSCAEHALRRQLLGVQLCACPGAARSSCTSAAG